MGFAVLLISYLSFNVGLVFGTYVMGHEPELGDLVVVFFGFPMLVLGTAVNFYRYKIRKEEPEWRIVWEG